MITDKTLATALKADYKPAKFIYVVTEKGPALASKLAKGYAVAGKIPDELTAGDTEMFILRVPKGEPDSPEKKPGRFTKLRGILKGNDRG